MRSAEDWFKEWPEYPWMNQIHKPKVLELIRRIQEDAGRGKWEEGYNQRAREVTEEDD